MPSSPFRVCEFVPDPLAKHSCPAVAPRPRLLSSLSSIMSLSLGLAFVVSRSSAWAYRFVKDCHLSTAHVSLSLWVWEVHDCRWPVFTLSSAEKRAPVINLVLTQYDVCAIATYRGFATSRVLHRASRAPVMTTGSRSALLAPSVTGGWCQVSCTS